MRILVVEDKKHIADFIQKTLTEHGYAVDLASTGDEVLDWPGLAEFDAIVLDIMLPGRDGMEVCRVMRQRGMHTPILMLTAKDAVEDRVRGLDSGADDYLVKPFAYTELLARLRAIMRRQGDGSKTSTLEVGDLCIDTASRRVQRAGKEIELRTKEYAILEYMARHPDQVLTRAMIADHVWNYDFEGASNVIDVHIRNLRSRLDEGFDQKLIQTLRGAGYRLSAGS